MTFAHVSEAVRAPFPRRPDIWRGGEDVMGMTVIDHRQRPLLSSSRKRHPPPITHPYPPLRGPYLCTFIALFAQRGYMCSNSSSTSVSGSLSLPYFCTFYTQWGAR
ncbi:hypothetical protein GOODEAATRI_019655 [Goodea atripinnis]|uniref:Uncharacterized protein n=1 Tax=Goodea atripinnis TaxID=208336 RepID=A0ABV0PZE3_9TELE